MRRCVPALVVVSMLCLTLVSQWTAAEDAPKKEHKVFVEVCVIEVSVSKLRALGFDWDAALRGTKRDADETHDPIAFLDALSKDNLARIVTHPRLATMSGRPASLQVGDAIKLDVVPQVLGEQKIQLEYRVELNLLQPNSDKPAIDNKEKSARQLVLDSATELEPGEACCVSETRARRTSDQGKVDETLTLVFLRADFKPPADIRTAERVPAPEPALERRYLEIEVPKRR